VCFLDGDPWVWNRVQQVAREWTDVARANVSLVFEQDPGAEIRVSFAHPGWWSKVGREALNVTPGSPTMNLGGVHPADNLPLFRQAVLHEFGHVLGCVHEHQSPDAGIQWNEENVYQYYAQAYGWSREYTRSMVFDRYTAEATQFTRFDRSSVMLYPIPSEFTLDGFSTPVNSRLSPTDRTFVASLYPGRS
jgi:serralysin